MTIISVKPAGALPINFSPQVVPFDAAASFGLGVTLTASGYAEARLLHRVGSGRMEVSLMLNVSSVALGSANEFYQFFLLGSYDPSFANGNLDILAAYDIAATAALRLLPTIPGANPAIPDVGLSAAQFVVPFSNQRDTNLFPFINLFVQMAARRQASPSRLGLPLGAARKCKHSALGFRASALRMDGSRGWALRLPSASPVKVRITPMSSRNELPRSPPVSMRGGHTRAVCQTDWAASTSQRPRTRRTGPRPLSTSARTPPPPPSL